MRKSGRKEKKGKTHPAKRPRGASARQELRESKSARLHSLLDALLHPQTPDERMWRYFYPLLALAFAARAAVALQGDSMLHFDEIVQHLEPAHRLVFGNGVTHWEFFYGVRSWLLPGLIAGVLKLFDAVGLDQPFSGTSPGSSWCSARSPC